MQCDANANGGIDLSVITPTFQRPGFLIHCLRQFQLQVLGPLRCEHIVVSDGPDAHAKMICDRFGCRYVELPVARQDYGSTARDLGIQLAIGDVICFWDDDNWYEPQTLAALFATVQDAEIGVARTEHRLRKRPGLVKIPRRWEGKFVNGDIDTMCVCVKSELAKKERWADGSSEVNSDYRWLTRLCKHDPKIHYVPTVIGFHV